MSTAVVAAEARFVAGYDGAATRTGLSEPTLRRLVRAGRLKTYRPNGPRPILFDVAELDRFVLAAAALADGAAGLDE